MGTEKKGAGIDDKATDHSYRIPAKRRNGETNETTIRLHIKALEEGGYVATSPDVPGLVAEGRSTTEAAEIAQDLTRKIVESCLEHGDPLPRALADFH